MSRARPPEHPLDIDSVSLRFGSHSIKTFTALLWDSLRDLTPQDGGVRMRLMGIKDGFYNVPNANVRDAGKKDYALDKSLLDAKQLVRMDSLEHAEKETLVRLLQERGIYGTTVSDVLRATGAFDEAHWSEDERNAGQREIQMLHLTASGWKATSVKSVAPGKATMYICTGVGCLICLSVEREAPIRTARVSRELEARKDSRTTSDIDAGHVDGGYLNPGYVGAGYIDSAVVPTGPRDRPSMKFPVAKPYRGFRGSGRGGLKGRYPNGHISPMPVSLVDLLDSNLRSPHEPLADPASDLLPASLVRDSTPVLQAQDIASQQHRSNQVQDPAVTWTKTPMPVPAVLLQRAQGGHPDLRRAPSMPPQHTVAALPYPSQPQILRHAPPIVPRLPVFTQTPPQPEQPTYSIAQPHFPTSAALSASLRRASSAIPILPATNLEAKPIPTRPTSRNSALSATAPVFQAPIQLQKLTMPTLPGMNSVKPADITDAEKPRRVIERKESQAWQCRIEPAVHSEGLVGTLRGEGKSMEKGDDAKEMVDMVDDGKSDVLQPVVPRVKTLKIVGDVKSSEENDVLGKTSTRALREYTSAKSKPESVNSPAATIGKIDVAAPSLVPVAVSPGRPAKTCVGKEAQRAYSENGTDAPAESVANSINTIQNSLRATFPPPLPQRARKKPKPNKEIRGRSKKRQETQMAGNGCADVDIGESMLQAADEVANPARPAQSKAISTGFRKTQAAHQHCCMASAYGLPVLPSPTYALSDTAPEMSKGLQTWAILDLSGGGTDVDEFFSKGASKALLTPVADTQHSATNNSDPLPAEANSKAVISPSAKINEASAPFHQPSPGPVRAAQSTTNIPSLLPTAEARQFWNTKLSEVSFAHGKRRADTEKSQHTRHDLPSAAKQARQEPIGTTQMPDLPAAVKPSSQFWDSKPKAPCFDVGERPKMADLFALQNDLKTRRLRLDGSGVEQNGVQHETHKESGGDNAFTSRKLQTPRTYSFTDVELFHSMPETITLSIEKQRATDVALSRIASASGKWRELSKSKGTVLLDTNKKGTSAPALNKSGTAPPFSDCVHANPMKTENREATATVARPEASTFSKSVPPLTTGSGPPMLTFSSPTDPPQARGPKTLSFKVNDRDARVRADEILRKKSQMESETRLRAGLEPIQRFKRPSLKALPETSKSVVVESQGSPTARVDGNAAVPPNASQRRPSTAAPQTTGVAVSRRSSRVVGDVELNAGLHNNRVNRIVSAPPISYSTNVHRKVSVGEQLQTMATVPQEQCQTSSVPNAVEARRAAIVNAGLARLAATYRKESWAKEQKKETAAVKTLGGSTDQLMRGTKRGATSQPVPSVETTELLQGKSMAALNDPVQGTREKLKPSGRFRSVGNSNLASLRIEDDSNPEQKKTNQHVSSFAAPAPPASPAHARQPATGSLSVVADARDPELTSDPSSGQKAVGNPPVKLPLHPDLAIHKLSGPVGRSWWQAALQASSRVSGLWLTDAYDYEEGCVPASPKSPSNTDDRADQ